MMEGDQGISRKIYSLFKNTRMVEKKRRRIVIGLKSDNSSREMLLRLLHSLVFPGDYLLAVHVYQSDDSLFDPNTFHIHEDLCKSKQVDFQVKVCTGSCYISELSNQVRINFATALAIGCTSFSLKDSLISRCMKAVPPTCSLWVMDNITGKLLVQLQGISQHGSAAKALRSSQSSLKDYETNDKHEIVPKFRRWITMPTSSSSITSSLQHIKTLTKPCHKEMFPDLQLFERLAGLEIKAPGKHFTVKELENVTSHFGSEALIGEGGHSLVYGGNLESGCPVAIKVFKESSTEDIFHEVEVLSGLKHENIVRLIGYCYSSEIRAVVYDLMEGSLKQRLKYLDWNERRTVAIGVAKALHFLHSCSPPIVHRDVKSSNILLSDNSQPKLSDFGAAMVWKKNPKGSEFVKPIPVVGTFGYMAPEYMMYGKVDDKIDVYSYGVVLLELITGREAIQATELPAKQESLVLWARKSLGCGLYERLIDPSLIDNYYDKDEMKTMIVAARLCLLHSSSRRPSMKTILQLFEEPGHLVEMNEREEPVNEINPEGESTIHSQRYSDSDEFVFIDDFQ